MEEAEKLAKLIIEKKMGACVDYWPVNSYYRWEGSAGLHSEVMILITTFESKLEDMNELISQNHTYATPLIAGVDVRRVNRSYKEWMTEEMA